MEDAEYDIMYRVEDTHWWYRALHKLLIDRLTIHVPDWCDKNLLDAGCGTGALLERLGRSETHIGVDLSPKAIAYCHERRLPGVLQADVNALPLAGESQDAVICSSVLYHQWIPDVAATLREFKRVLKLGGILLLNFPALACLHSPHDEKVFTARRFSRKQVNELLSRNGFEVVECGYWTSLLFPFIWAARRFSLVTDGRDFEPPHGSIDSLAQRTLNCLMTVELTLLNRIRFPAGVSIYAVARKRT